MSVGQWIHLSIDDVIGCFQWVYEKQPKSIFDEPMLGAINRWHKRYGIHCDLYVFERCIGFSLDQLQDCYWNELKEESFWLKLAWHGKETELSAGQKDSVDSFERIYGLLETKLGKSALAESVRLHMWTVSEELLDKLRQKGVRVLLTSDSGKSSYQLTEDEAKILVKQGCIYREPFHYRKTNIRLDRLEDNSLQKILEETEENFRRYPLMQSMELFFHEWKFHKLADRLEQYWAEFGTIHLPILASAGVQVEDKIYFTSCNTCNLFMFDMKSREISTVISLPCSTNCLMKYSSLVYYKGAIWMIPKHENEILVYDMNKEYVLNFPLPFLPQGEREDEKFRKAVQCGQYLWLLPATAECIVKIDMEEYSVSIISDWPVDYHNAPDVNFGMMYQCENKLYLLKKHFPVNLMVNIEKNEVFAWSADLPGCFGMMLDEYNVLCSPVDNGEPLVLIDISTGKRESFSLPDWIWQEERYAYSFWYAKKIENKVFLLPCDANAVIVYDIDNKEINLIELHTDAGSYLLPVKGYSAYDIFETGTHKYIFPYTGNMITVIAHDMEIVDNIYLYTTVGEERYCSFSNSCVKSEGRETTLDKYLEGLKRYKNGKWKKISGLSVERTSVGAKIFESVN